MKGRKHRYPLPFLGPTADLHDALIYVKERVVSVPPQDTDNPRSYHIDLVEEIPLARLNLVRLGISVTRGSAFQDIADENVAPGKARPRDQPVQQLPGSPDKGSSLLVLFLSRGLPDKHEFGLLIAFTKNHRSPAETQVASGAVDHRLPQQYKRLPWTPFSAVKMVDPHPFQGREKTMRIKVIMRHA